MIALGLGESKTDSDRIEGQNFRVHQDGHWIYVVDGHLIAEIHHEMGPNPFIVCDYQGHPIGSVRTQAEAWDLVRKLFDETIPNIADSPT